MIPEDVLYLPVRELGRRIQRRELSPVELTAAYLERLERHGPGLGAVVSILRESALAEARAAEAEIRGGRYRGPLHGMPYGVKDLLAVRGAPTTWGAEPYRERTIDYDATIVRRLREAGAVLVAKLAMVEIAGGMGYDEATASLTGAARTPWNPAYWAGGSSSGSGAAVAAALVPFAIGTETWGSIVTPAAFSGVTGLRPTIGRVSRHGAMALSWTMDKIGPMCRTADDCGLVLEAIAGPDPEDPVTLDLAPFAYAPPSERRRFRVGVLQGAREKVQPDVAANFDAALEVVRGFAELVEDVELPDHPYGAAAGLIIDAEAASAHEELLASGQVQQLTAPGSRTGGYSGAVVLATDYIKALRLRGVMQRALHERLSEFDAVVHPTRATVAYPVDRKFREAYPGLGSPGAAGAIGGAANVAGLPGIALPNGFGENGLPTSLSFTGRAFEEDKLIALAVEYQSRTDWHTRRPALGAGG